MESILAIALLSVPVPVGYDAGLARTLSRYCLSAELLDPREVRYVLADELQWDNDLALLRSRYAELHDAPRVADALRFPPRPIVNDWLAFNRAYRRSVDALLPLNQDRPGVCLETLKECDTLYQVYDLVRDAGCEYYYVAVRRQALAKLRKLLGDEAYYDGVLPPFVPVWRFTEDK